MERADIETIQKCPGCGTDTCVAHVFVVERRTPRYSESWQCSCGYVAEMDGNEIPSHVLDAFIQRDGKWHVQVDGLSGELADGVPALVEACGLDRRDALSILKNPRGGDPLLCGIVPDARDLSSFLAERGVVCSLSRVKRF